MIVEPTSKIKNEQAITKTRIAAKIVAKILAAMKAASKPGISGFDLNQIAIKMIADSGCESNFLGYHDFPATVCVSIDEQLIHGIPTTQPFRDGSLVSLDFGVSYQGQHADAAISFLVGTKKNPAATAIMKTTKIALDAVISDFKPGNTTEDIAAIIEAKCVGTGYVLTAEYTGHGIGTALHELPNIPNVTGMQTPQTLVPGMIICIEPMLLTESSKLKTAADGWTVSAMNGKLTCHMEDTILVTDQGLEVLTTI